MKGARSIATVRRSENVSAAITAATRSVNHTDRVRSVIGDTMEMNKGAASRVVGAQRQPFSRTPHRVQHASAN